MKLNQSPFYCVTIIYIYMLLFKSLEILDNLLTMLIVIAILVGIRLINSSVCINHKIVAVIRKIGCYIGKSVDTECAVVLNGLYNLIGCAVRFLCIIRVKPPTKVNVFLYS